MSEFQARSRHVPGIDIFFDGTEMYALQDLRR